MCACMCVYACICFCMHAIFNILIYLYKCQHYCTTPTAAAERLDDLDDFGPVDGVVVSEPEVRFRELRNVHTQNLSELIRFGRFSVRLDGVVVSEPELRFRELRNVHTRSLFELIRFAPFSVRVDGFVVSEPEFRFRERFPQQFYLASCGSTRFPQQFYLAPCGCTRFPQQF